MSTKFHYGLALVLAGGVMSSGCVARAKVRAHSGPGHTEGPPPEPVRHGHGHPTPPDRGPAPKPERVLKAKWDNNGWILLGERMVDGSGDRDTIPVGRENFGKLTHAMVVVEDDDLILHDMIISFGNGQRISPNLKHHFRENERTRQIDFPMEGRTVAKVEFTYSDLPGGGRAKVALWGKKKPGDGKAGGGGGAGAKPMLKADWDRGGWVKLGNRVVKGKAENKDVIKVGKGAGPFTRLMVVVEDSELEVDTMTVTFGNNETFEPEVKHMFREDDRTRPIDLPGETRNIKKIEFAYKNLPGKGKAKVEVWAKKE